MEHKKLTWMVEKLASVLIDNDATVGDMRRAFTLVEENLHMVKPKGKPNYTFGIRLPDPPYEIKGVDGEGDK